MKLSHWIAVFSTMTLLAGTLGCLTPSTVLAGPGDPTPTRIAFLPGASAATVEDGVEAAGMNSYVLTARQGQTMWVTVHAISGAAILVIWGADGTVLISDHADATSWSGELPATQDYNIDVKGSPDSATAYTLQVVIPARLTGQTTVIDEKAAGGQIRLNSGDQLTVTLASNPTTGYLWEIQTVDAGVLQPVGEWEFESNSDALGAGGTETRRFVAIASGQTTLEMVYHRPWERDAPPVNVLRVTVTVR
jgi:inhibitor of cysteine peptidase